MKTAKINGVFQFYGIKHSLYYGNENVVVLQQTRFYH